MLRSRVLVIDDNSLPRYAVRAMLAATSAFEVVGEAASGPDGIRQCRLLRPDVVLLDVEMPGMDGAATARAILELPPPQPKVIAWTIAESGDEVIRMIRAGCAGYILKDAGPDEVMRAIESALRGESPVPRKLIPAIIARAVARERPVEDATGLSRREMDVLQRLARGQSTKDIAREIGISVRSVDSYLRNLYRKLQVGSRGQAVHEATQRGLISSEDL